MNFDDAETIEYLPCAVVSTEDGLRHMKFKGFAEIKISPFNGLKTLKRDKVQGI